MIIKCLNCKKYEFDINISSFEVENAPVVSLTCPDCGKSTAMQKRDSGGIEIALDKHLDSVRN
jgi:hypothetical protein